MVEMMIKSLQDQSLNTVLGHHWLVEGEVKLVQFKNMQEFDAYVSLGVIKPAPQGAMESKMIPVIPVPMENGLPTALHDGEQFLELSNDPEVEIDPEEIPNEVTVAALEEEDLTEVGSVEELMEELEEEDPEEDEEEDEGDWTSEIDHV